LTPFGFQSEERTTWEAQETYLNMSPFMYPDKVKTPILLIHGEADDNGGTFPIQSQPVEEAVRGNAATVRLVIPPNQAHGYPVSGVQKDDFQIFEDGVLQEISLFRHEDIPESIGLVIDNGGSTHNKWERVNLAALTFARESNSEDVTFIVNFDDQAYLQQDF